MACVVYWLFDNRCVCPWRHGYIGVSVEFDARLRRHHRRAGTRKSAVGVQAFFDHKILFTGTVEECAALEECLRPRKGIGWNRAQGGRKPWLDYKHDAAVRAKISDAVKKSGHMKSPKPPETCAKISAAKLKYYSDPANRAAVVSHLKALHFDRAGSSNGHFGKPHSDAAKRKIGAANQKAVCKRGHQKPPGKPCRECQRIHNRRAYAKRCATSEEISL